MNAAGNLNLTISETERLTELETTIEHGLQTFVEVGNALMEIRDRRFYRAEYGTFEEYCRDRWGMSRSYAHRTIEAAQVVSNLLPIGNIPANEAQTRPLAQLPPEQQQTAWQEVVDTAPNGKVTASHVQDVVDNFNYKRDNKSSTPRYTPQGLDACQTPAYALDPLLPYLPEGLNVWEPACGEGLLEDALFDSGYHVVSGDLQTEQDFFEYEPEAWDCQVTNPPFSKKFPWLKRCYELGKPFALLLPVETLGAKTAQEMFDQFGIEVIFMDKRINFKMPNKGWDGGGAQFPVAWFTWGLNIGQQMTFAKVVPDNAETN